MKKEHPFVVKLRWQIKKTPTKKPYMSIVNTLSLESNRQWIIRSWKTSYTDERYRSSAHMIYSLYICIFLSYQGAYKEELSHHVINNSTQSIDIFKHIRFPGDDLDWSCILNITNHKHSLKDLNIFVIEFWSISCGISRIYKIILSYKFILYLLRQIFSKFLNQFVHFRSWC